MRTYTTTEEKSSVGTTRRSSILRTGRNVIKGSRVGPRGKRGIMKKVAIILAIILLSAAVPVFAAEEFDATLFKSATQSELAGNPKAWEGKKVKVSDPFQFCGSDFCVQIRTVRINTKEYFCFNLGSLCLIRMYLKKDHSQAVALQTARKGDLVTVYGTFETAGGNFNYVVADRIEIVKKK